MHDRELKKLLLETCPVRPGQEGRAWSALRERLDHAKQARSQSRPLWSRLFYPIWRPVALAALAVVLVPTISDLIVADMQPVALATADSQSPEVYATAFYSRSAQAQVVWLTGMDPAGDKPTYLDPTTSVSGAAGDPNSL